MKSKIVYLGIFVILFGICLFAILPLFHAGYFTMHDDEQIARLQQMYLVLSQGQIPPRWVPDLGFGFGYPLFNFYPPLVYYLGSLFHLVGFSLINAIKLVMGLGFLLASGSMFLWVKKHYGIIAGIFAAILYTYAPYHSVDLYVRGALAEFFSWIWIPLIFWSVDMLFETLQKKYIFFLGIFLALLMLSHSLVMLQLAPILPIYTLFVWLQNKKNRRGLFLFALAVLIGLGLSAYFWLPSLAEKQYTLVDTILTKELANYAIHFVCPIQLWSGLWGYGGSVGGCVDGLSFQIGKIQILAGVAGILLSIFFMFKKTQIYSFGIAVLFLCSIFLTLSYSQFLWDIARPFWYIQFPWRYLLFAAVFSSFLGGFVLHSIKKQLGQKAAIAIGLSLALLAIFQVRNYFQPQSYRQVADRDLTSFSDIKWRVSGMSYEYVPSVVATKKSPVRTTEVAIQYQDIPTKSYQVVTGRMQIKEEKSISYLKMLSVNVYNQGIIQINTYNFPGWQVFVDGRKTDQLIKNPLDLIQISLPVGQHSVLVQFVNTPVRTVANALSALTLAILIGSILYIGLKSI